MQYKGYKFRIYPTEAQKVLIEKTFGCCRYVYNRALALKIQFYEREKEGLSIFSLMKEITQWKEQEETKWLKEVNSQALQMSLRHLDAAFTNFFKKRSAFPKFKSKSDNHQAFYNPQKTKIDFDSKKVFIPKFKQGIKCIFHRQFKGNIKSSIISKTPSGKYFISILIQSDDSNPIYQKIIENEILGIDLGIKNFATFSDGTIIENPQHLNKKLNKLKREQRRLSRKKIGSKNRNKQRLRVARTHEKIANSRKDFLHKLTHQLVENQDYSSIAIEDLNVADMLKKGKRNKLSRHITDVGWGMFRQFLAYKCKESGKNLLVIGRFEPSSRLCSCGQINHNLTLKDREWDCPSCHSHHKRDELAAKNIVRFAFCKQNTYNNLIGQELAEFTPLEICNSESLKKEIFTVST